MQWHLVQCGAVAESRGEQKDTPPMSGAMDKKDSLTVCNGTHDPADPQEAHNTQMDTEDGESDQGVAG